MGPGFETRYCRYFSDPCIPAPRPIQPPVQLVTGLLLVGKVAGAWGFLTAPGLRMHTAVCLHVPAWYVTGQLCLLPYIQICTASNLRQPICFTTYWNRGDARIAHTEYRQLNTTKLFLLCNTFCRYTYKKNTNNGRWMKPWRNYAKKSRHIHLKLLSSKNENKQTKNKELYVIQVFFSSGKTRILRYHNLTQFISRFTCPNLGESKCSK